MKRIKKLLTLLLVLTLSCTGCSSKNIDVEEPDIELLEPVSQGANTERAAKRTLYKAVTYSAGVYPFTKEYSFTESLNVLSFPFMPGDSVKAGDIICYGDTKDIDKSIERAEEALLKLTEDYEEQKLSNNSKLSELKKKRASEASGSAGFKLADIEINKLVKQMENKKAIYELDYEHSLAELEQLKEKREAYLIRSETDGVISAVKSFDYNNTWVSKNTPVIAVSDTSRKKIVCDYINKTTVRKAADVYAIINGQRYEVEHQAIDTATYTQLSQEGTVYSDFYFLGDASAVNPGDYAVIEIINQKLENVVSIPGSAIMKDTQGTYVYVHKNGENEYRTVKTGFSDGYFTEIVSGLEEGEEVIVKEPANPQSETLTVSYGSVSNSFVSTGYMSFPSGHVVSNPVEYATVYFGEYLVSRYETVTEDTVIATIRTVSDEMEYKRTEKNLARLQERFKELKATETGHMSESELKRFKKSLEEAKKNIEDTEAKLEKILKDAETTEILAGFNGIITSLSNFSNEQIIGSGATIAQIADVNNCYVVIEDEKNQLKFGSKVSIAYESKTTGAQSTAEGEVVMMDNVGLSRNLASNQMIIRVDPAKLSDMPLTSGSDYGWWNRTTYKTTAVTRAMNNVLFIPRNAVIDRNGQTYVYVKNSDGTVTETPFAPGGSDTFGYWVAEGITEGTIVCLK